MVQKESSTIIGWVRGAETIGVVEDRSLILRDFLAMVTERSLPLVLGGKGQIRLNSERVWVQTYFPGTVPPFPGGGGDLSSSASSFLSVIVAPSVVSPAGGGFDAVSGDDGAWVLEGGNPACAGFDVIVSVVGGVASANDETSNPSSPNSITSSSFGFSGTDAAFFLATFCFFFSCSFSFFFCFFQIYSSVLIQHLIHFGHSRFSGVTFGSWRT